jgi:hypothetical protein
VFCFIIMKNCFSRCFFLFYLIAPEICLSVCVFHTITRTHTCIFITLFSLTHSQMSLTLTLTHLITLSLFTIFSYYSSFFPTWHFTAQLNTEIIHWINAVFIANFLSVVGTLKELSISPTGYTENCLRYSRENCYFYLCKTRSLQLLTMCVQVFIFIIVWMEFPLALWFHFYYQISHATNRKQTNPNWGLSRKILWKSEFFLPPLIVMPEWRWWKKYMARFAEAYSIRTHSMYQKHAIWLRS